MSAGLTVVTPALVIVTSPVTGTETKSVPLPIRICALVEATKSVGAFAIPPTFTVPRTILANLLLSTASLAIVTAPEAIIVASPEIATDFISVPSPTKVYPEVFASKSVGALEAPPTFILPLVILFSLSFVTASSAISAVCTNPDSSQSGKNLIDQEVPS